MDNKELYNMITEIGERTARTETKVDSLMENDKKIETVKDIAVEARSETSRAHQRLDAADKWRFSVGSAAVIAVVTSILNLILNTK